MSDLLANQAVRRIGRFGASIVQWAFSFFVGWLIWRFLISPHLSEVVVTSFQRIGDALKTTAKNGSLWKTVKTTLGEALAGFAAGTAIGLLLALVIALTPRLIGKVLEPIIVVLYAAPKYVLVPLLFIRFGSGFEPRFYLVTLAVFPVVSMYVLTGLRTVDPDTVAVMRLFGMGRRQIAQKVMVPHAGSYLVTAVVYVIPHALSMAIGAEILFGTTQGLGGQMFADSQQFNSAGIYSTLAVATALAVLLVGLTRVFERRYSPMARSGRARP